MSDFNDFIKDWNKYKLDIKTDRGVLTVKWNDADTLARWSNMQSGLYLQNNNSLQTFYECFPRWHQMFWDARFEKGVFDLPDDAVIMDIGSGVAVIDLLLAQYLPKSKYYLLDKEGFEFYPGVYYDIDYPNYHSWEPVLDGISSTGLDADRFTFMSPSDPWPEQVDVVTSYFSYCWHYPKDVYWDQIMGTLKTGGKLILDVRSLIDRDIVGEISQDMKSQPMIHWFDKKLPAHIDNMPAPKDGMPVGGRFIWTKK